MIPEVEDKDVTVRKADLSRDIRSFISYAVGCMFGRYSIYNLVDLCRWRLECCLWRFPIDKIKLDEISFMDQDFIRMVPLLQTSQLFI